tara:strand:+ start:6880 stop:7812 length:933 start_codon:yes stop_codon:yes gene_type:complete
MIKPIRSVKLEEFEDKFKLGKTRDLYVNEDQMMIIATDRISSFDKVFGVIPGKGNILHKITKFWFDNTKDIIDNHIIDIPCENVLNVNKYDVYPVEVIVRGFITGMTDTSLWTLYNNGDRSPYGVELPDGLQFNDRLPEPIITPTTKAEYGKHDEVLTEAGIIDGSFVSEDKWLEIKYYSWEYIRETAFKLFERGQQVAKEAGLILVDTKYEFGYKDGKIYLIDEIHTPDSSRYWLLEDYESNKTITNYDKEFFRSEIKNNNGVITNEIEQELMRRYIAVYEKLSGNSYVLPKNDIKEDIISYINEKMKV